MQILLILAALLAALVVAALAAGAARASRRAAELRAELARAPAPRDVSAALPEPVRAFAVRADAHPSDLARRVSFAQSVEMRLKPGGRWQPMTALQTVSIGAPGFVWEAGQDLGPLPKFRVVDAYTPGRGRLDVNLFGGVPVVRAKGPDLTRGEAMRYLAELPWTPDAILGNPELAWRMADDGWAEVSMQVEGAPVMVRFRFDSAGDIVEVFGPDRPAEGPDGKTVRRDWKGHFRDYRMIGPRRIPAEGEVGYVTEAGYAPYFQGRITAYEAVH